MSDIFISYARSTAPQAQAVTDALRALGYGVWRDDELPAHRAYTDVIEERLRAAKAVVVIWSAEAVKSQWVRAEAEVAREAGTLVQLTTDGAPLPLPFNQIQCADLAGWTGDAQAHGWRKVVASVADLVGVGAAQPSPGDEAVLSLPSKPSIAVLPFANLSGDPEQAYFADGMLLEIVEALSRSKSIFVIASGSSLSFKGKGVTAQEAARQLGVRFVLEGSVRKAGNRVRIGVQLVDAMDGASIWTERFEDTLDDVFALQDKVALAVAGRIEPTVQQAEIHRVSKRPTENMGSYDLYLRALATSRPALQAEMPVTIQQLDRAIALDPDFGPALAVAALNRWLVVAFGWSNDPAEDLRQSVELAHRALRAANDDAQVLAMVAQLTAYVERDLPAAIALIDRALALNPGSESVWFPSSGLRLAAGDAALALEHIETAMRLDPVGPNRLLHAITRGNALFAQRRFAEALTCFKEMAQQQPDNFIGPLAVAALSGHLGETDAAREALDDLRRLTPESPAELLSRWSSTSTPEFSQLWRDGLAKADGGG